MAELQTVLEGMTAVLKSLAEKQTEAQQNSTPPATHVPKFEHFDRNVEPWEQYMQRFNQHLLVYRVADEQKKACLLSWVGAETYQLILNLCGGAEAIEQQSFNNISMLLADHFKAGIHIQAARYKFYNCKMQSGETYSDWAARLRGLGKDCAFHCNKTGCGTGYLDEQIRDVIIKESPHPDIRRQCLLETNPSLQDVLVKANTYIRTSETDAMLKGAVNTEAQMQPSVNQMSRHNMLSVAYRHSQAETHPTNRPRRQNRYIEVALHASLPTVGKIAPTSHTHVTTVAIRDTFNLFVCLNSDLDRMPMK